ncbi:MAG: hypothetical protein PHY64_03810 [Eubacteriales bacterium]|nr:hypothetical protein [Eubacteriales bacterium]
MHPTIRRTLALAAAVLLLFWAVPAFAADAAMFTPQDMNVNATYAGATQEEVRSAFGAPQSTETTTLQAAGETQEVWTYDQLTLTFTDGSLTGAQWTNPTLIGPRGLKVGDLKETVISAFYADPAQTDKNLLYTAGYVEELGSQLPPYGAIIVDGTSMIRYCAPMEAYDDSVLSDPMNYVYWPLASLSFTLNSDGDTVDSIAWRVAAPAE